MLFATTNIMSDTENQQTEGTEAEKTLIFEKEFLPHADALYNFAYKLTYNGDEAGDLVQETFLKSFKYALSYQQGTNAKAWLFRILKNTFINDFRKKSKEPAKVDYNEVESYYNSDETDVNVTTDLRIDTVKGMMGDEITLALNSLDVDFRTIIILCDLEGFKYDEMAKILDIPIGTVRSRLHRARQMLKEKLKSYASEMGYLK